MICAEFAFSHVSISNAPVEDDTDFLRSLSGITPALACKSIGAQITRCIQGSKGQTEYRSKRLVIISGFPPDLRALQLFSTKFPWIDVKAIVFFNASPMVFADRVRTSKDYSPELDDVESIVTDYNSLVLPLLQSAKRQGKLYAIEDDGQAGDVFTRVRGCILAVVVDHLASIAKTMTTGITQSKAKNLEDFKRYQHEPVSSRKEDTERFVESLQRDRELRMVHAQQKKIAEAEEVRLQKEKKQKEMEEEKQQKQAKEAQLALAKRNEEVEKAARLKMQQRGQHGRPPSFFPGPPQVPPAFPFGHPSANSRDRYEPRQQSSSRLSYEPRPSYESSSRDASSYKRQADEWRDDSAKRYRDSSRPLPSWAL